jgi:DNA mismatch endonuclease (patch repair protein)
MSQVRAKDTGPEMEVRRALHAAGYRFRLYRKDLPGTPDLVLSKYKTAVLVHGCFWHGHGCARSKLPDANREYWENKVKRNRARDIRTTEALERLGWRVFVIWECELKARLEQLLSELNSSRAGGSTRN